MVEAQVRQWEVKQVRAALSAQPRWNEWPQNVFQVISSAEVEMPVKLWQVNRVQEALTVLYAQQGWKEQRQ